jgi:hypothetical protein
VRPLTSVTLRDNQEFQTERVKKKLWPKRLWSRMAERRGTERSSTHLNTLSIDQETAELMGTSLISNERDDLAMLENLQTISSTQTSSTSKSNHISLGRAAGAIAINIFLSGLISRHTIEKPEDLKISASPDGLFTPRFVMGKFVANASIETGRLVFPNIRLSSGRLHIKRIALNWLVFLLNKTKTSRYASQFDLLAEDWVFSRHDLLFSSCIKNGLRLLLVRILRDKGVDLSSIQISSLDILVSSIPTSLAIEIISSMYCIPARI